jgi:hypothetical protein
MADNIAHVGAVLHMVIFPFMNDDEKRDDDKSSAGMSGGELGRGVEVIMWESHSADTVLLDVHAVTL